MLILKKNILYNDINVAENREAIWLNVWLVGLVLTGDVRLRRRQCWTAGSTRMAQNAQKSRHVRHFLGRMSQYRAFGNGVDFLAEKRGETSAAGFFAWGEWTDWMVQYSLDGGIQGLYCETQPRLWNTATQVWRHQKPHTRSMFDMLLLWRWTVSLLLVWIF